MRMSRSCSTVGAERAEGVEVRVQPAAADHVAAGRRHQRRAEAGQQRAGDQERGADALGERRRSTSVAAHVVGLQRDRVVVAPLDAHAEVGEQREHRLDVADARHVVQHDLLVGEQAAASSGRAAFLLPAGTIGAGQRHAALR